MKSIASVLTLAIAVVLMTAGCSAKESKPATEVAKATPAQKAVPAPAVPIKIVMKTNIADVAGGMIEMELYPDKAPKTVENFVKLAGQGFYDGLRFHRVVPGFVIQGGDPQTKDPAMKDAWGSGGPGYRFDDELVKGDYARGALAMANSGPNTNGSQFFICVSDLSGRLPKQYNYFGMVTKGMEVVDAIVARPRDQRDRPVEDVIMEKVTVVK